MNWSDSLIIQNITQTGDPESNGRQLPRESRQMYIDARMYGQTLYRTIISGVIAHFNRCFQQVMTNEQITTTSLSNYINICLIW